MTNVGHPATNSIYLESTEGLDKLFSRTSLWDKVSDCELNRVEERRGLFGQLLNQFIREFVMQ